MARHCSPLKKIDKKLQNSLPQALPVSGLKSSKNHASKTRRTDAGLERDIANIS